jgi:alpha-glucosidase
MLDPDWWRNAVVYQIYPRSFADADADGIGDIRGITSRVHYLSALGIDAVWLSPFYPSALVDGGYDVDDYRDVDPRLGTLADFTELAEALCTHGMKLIVDIVPNHTSNRHAWFREAVTAKAGSPARDRYVIRDGTGAGGSEPPSDWQSVFGGSAWSRLPDGQWYLHLFAEEQPDLNWDCREVREDFLTTLRFWSDRGADGFRVDVAHGLSKRLDEPLPSQAQLPTTVPPDGSHPFWDRDAVHDIYREWRAVFNEYSPPRTAVAEAWVHPSRRTRYASNDGLGQVFNFDLLHANFDATEFRSVIDSHLGETTGTMTSSTWVLSNHDVVRHATRYGLPAAPRHASAQRWLSSDGRHPPLARGLGLRRARAATLLALALPGSMYLYQGEELGLHEVGDLLPAAIQDPVYRRSAGAAKGRDGCRVPLPWSMAGESFGFGRGGAHLPQPGWFAEVSVQAQESDPNSTLLFYRRAIELRKQLRPADSLEWVANPNPSVLHLSRPGGWHIVTNFGVAPVDLPPGRPVISSHAIIGSQLPGAATVWLK